MLFSRRSILAFLFVISLIIGFAVARYVVPRYAPEIGKFYASEGDADDDGRPDGNDNCPDDYNPNQNDNDGDGIGNRCDPTPNGDEAGPDDDLDGFSNDVDNCPSDFNPAQNDCDGDGIGNICDDHPGCGGGGGGDGGGSCDKSKLSASFNGGTVTITNSGDGACDVHATSWEVYDRFLPEFLDSQVRVSAPTGTVGGNRSIQLSVDVPNCSHQVDAGVGSPPGNAHYGSNYIDGQITFEKYFCDGSCVEDGCDAPPTTPPPPPNNPPVGSFDQADCTDVRGWARDPDTDPLPSDNNGPVQVQIWNGPAQPNSTNLLAQVVANQPREPQVGNHAFVWPIPANIKDGRMLNIYVYAIDNQNPAVSTLLTGSPRAVDTQLCLPPTSHMSCVNNACTFVVGPGTSTCAVDADCAAPTHLACVNNACTAVAGVGGNTCAINADCAAPTHLACVNSACTAVAGAGTNTCATNADCVTQTHLACVNSACTSVTGPGGNQCSTNADCSTPPPLACVPTTQSATSGQEVSITASGGIRPYSWSALNGNPTTDGDKPVFKVRFVNTTDPSRTFPVNVTDAADGAATCTVTVACPQAVCNPSPGCTYQNGNRCSCGTLVCPSNSPFSCAPPSQTISVGDTADFQTGGGTSPYTWTAPGSSQLSPNGSRASARYNQPGSYSVQVRDGQGRTAVCNVNAQSTATPLPTPPPTSPALSIQKTVRLYPNGTEQESVTANPAQTVEFAIRVSSNGSGTATQVVVRDTLPSGLTYQTGTTTVDNVAAADGIIGSGLSLGDMAPGRTITVRFRALVAPAQFFGGGTTILTNLGYARASNTSEFSDTAQVRVGTITQVQTGPGETAGLALIVSAIVTLLYVGYASSEKFRLREAQSSAKEAQQDSEAPDFKR